MFRVVKTVRLDDYGRPVVELFEGVSLSEAVAMLEVSHPHAIVEASYTSA